MAHVEDGLITLDLLMVNLCPGKRPKYKRREMEFFIRLVRVTPMPAWTRLKPYLIPTGVVLESTPGAACKTLTDINKNKDFNECLLECERHLLNQLEAEGLRRLHVHIYTLRELALVGDEESRTGVRNQFYNEHRRTVTTRIITCLSRLFGASVLLAPTIDIRTCTSIPTLSTTFPKIVALRKELLSHGHHPTLAQLEERETVMDDKNDYVIKS
ncbi:hypothetical protein EDD85DRAFT_863927 [Armillaria nabsnona]|nr:hypothetical protein EDD85DRAFT_863927 [Armillaria nabsnona]